jgi:hypothetical protein
MEYKQKAYNLSTPITFYLKKRSYDFWIEY